ncbi:MAG: amino acid ABC transporter permease [Pseudohongiella sp.]|nr:MAG: amino acid ABC transporter permease [Pseudohongiella sp.]
MKSITWHCLILVLGFLGIACALVPSTSSGQTISVGSKNFTENYLLAEAAAQLLEYEGYEVERNFGMTGTLIAYQALKSREIDVYFEYTGTLSASVLDFSGEPSIEALNQILSSEGLELLDSLGFNNTYALTLKKEFAESIGVSTISQLAAARNIVYGFSLEFLNRDDGWPGLVDTYGFTQVPTGMDHGLAYQAIDDGSIHVTDAYSTDGDLDRYGLLILEDDREFFPQYYAAALVHDQLPQAARRIIERLSGRIDEARMRDLNSRVVIDNKGFAEVAIEFLSEEGLVSGLSATSVANRAIWDALLRNVAIHLQLTLTALSLGCLVGLGFGILIYRSKRISQGLIYFTGLLQTIPSIALLALMIPLFGIGQTPAIIALFLYSLLPILRSTITALVTIDPLLKNVAEALGMSRPQQLRYVLLPLALPNVLTGIKTAAIISIGTATLAAFIGAGGLGEPIVTGLALNDTSLILQGAIPAACLAIVVELLFEQLERRLVKPHMREHVSTSVS